MGVEQLIINGLKNLDNKEFKNIFGDLYQGIIQVPFKNLKKFNESPVKVYNTIMVGVFYRTEPENRFNLLYADNNIMYISIPENEIDKNLLVKNWYLHFLSYSQLEIDNDFIYRHRNKDCINSVKVGFSESLEKIDRKFSNKKGLCFDCHKLFDLDFKDCFINGLPSLLSTGCASSL